MLKIKLTRSGNSLALILDKTLLEQTRINADALLEVTEDGEVNVLSKAGDKKRDKKLNAAVADAHRRYGKVFRNLAK